MAIVRQFNINFTGATELPLSNFFLLSSLLLSLFVMGCGRGPEVPLDDRTIDILTRMRIVEARIIFDDGRSVVWRRDDDIEIYRKLMSSLMPIGSHLEGVLDNYEYEMISLGGKDPCRILVRIGADNQIEYQWGRFVYTGGNAVKFQETLDEVIKRKESRARDLIFE